MNNDIDIVKIVITLINFGVIGWLVFWMGWHFIKVRKLIKGSHDWWVQVIFLICTFAALCCEIPALWVRLLTYYKYHTFFTGDVMVLNTWDRWGHLVFYLMFATSQWIVSIKRIPKIVKDTLG